MSPASGQARKGRVGSSLSGVLGLLSPWLVTAVIAALTLALFCALRFQDSSRIRSSVKSQLGNLQVELTEIVHNQVGGLERMGQRWSQRGRPSRQDWREDATFYGRQCGDFHDIVWVDPEFRVRWVAQLSDDPTVIGSRADRDVECRLAIEAAMEGKRTAVTAALKLQNGHQGFFAYIPVYVGGDFDGFLVGAFSIDRLLDKSVGRLTKLGFGVAVFGHGRTVFEQGGHDKRLFEEWGSSALVDVYGNKWTLSVCPSAALLADMRSALPIWVLVAGLVLALLVGFTLRIGQATASQAEELSRTQRELLDSYDQLETRVIDRTAEMAATNTRLGEELDERGRREEVMRSMSASLEKRTAELEQANEQLQAFCYSVSHDLRGPLRSIDGFSKVVLDDSGKDLSDSARGNLSRVRHASQRMGLLIDELLSLSRLAKYEPNLKSVDLSKIAREVADRQLEHDPGREIGIVIADKLEAVADEKLIREVLSNLFANAWKFTADVDKPTITFGREHTDKGDAFFVRDNGRGFEPAFQGKLFRMFERLHTVEHLDGAGDSFEGTGMGLATVKRIVLIHGGRVWANGVPNKGATFYFTLGP